MAQPRPHGGRDGQRSQIGHGNEIGVVKHSTTCACWHMLITGGLYRRAGCNYFTQRDPKRATRRVVAQLERLAHMHARARRRLIPTDFPFSRAAPLRHLPVAAAAEMAGAHRVVG